MINKLFIAEKPSLAEHIAGALGELNGQKPSKLDGYWKVGDDAVTWLFGHMCELAEPKAYGDKWAKWTIESLPMLPGNDEWKLVVSEDKKAQVSKVRSFIKDSKNIVNAGDPAREGQLLIDEVVIECGSNPFAKNVERLWVQSMARKDMLIAISAMKPNSDKKNLYLSAVCRQRADWQHGMNFSRLFTILAQNSGADAKISVGRVQTPTLRLIVDRDRERLNFKAVDYFLPKIKFKHANGEFSAIWIPKDDYQGLDSEGRLIDKSVAESLISKISGKEGKIRNWKNELKFTLPPLPHSLDTLQAECGAKFGMTAKQVLDIAQSLYEKHKATSYPRTDSRHLPLTILSDEAPEILRNLKNVSDLKDGTDNFDIGLKSPAWDDSKVSDHHGLIPTSEFKAHRLESMSSDEKNVFLIIAKTFLAQFHSNFKYRALSAEVSCEQESFKTTGRQITDQGWKVVYGAEEEEEDVEAEQTLPSMSQGDEVYGMSGILNPRRTSPPPAFTDGTLITAMANVHKFVTDESIKKRLKENSGIGTTATRADIIETLIKRTFIKRKGKNGLESSELGRSIIDTLPESLKSAGLTAFWEEKLSEVEKGSLSLPDFMEQQNTSIKEMVSAHKNRALSVKGSKTIRPMDGQGTECPKCSKGQLMTLEVHAGGHKGKRYLRCTNRENCDFVKWEAPKVKPLPGQGESCPGCKKGTLETRIVNKEGPSKGKSFLSCTSYPDCKHFEWERVPAITGDGLICSKCNVGHMKTLVVKKEGANKGKKFLGCDSRECGNVIFPEDAVDPLPGHGKECNVCKQGKMKTKGITAKDGRKFRLLVCSIPPCKNEEWPPRDFDPKTKSLIKKK